MLFCLTIIFGLGLFIFMVCAVQYQNESSSYKKELEKKVFFQKIQKTKNVTMLS